MKHWSQRDTHISAVVDYARTRIQKADQDRIETFIRAFFRNAPPEDLVARPVDMLFGIALSMWKFAERRTPGQPRIRVFNPTIEEHGWHTSHSVIQMVNDDMPFLVGSVTGNLAAAGTDVHFVIHPMMTTIRDADGRRTIDNSEGGSAEIRESLIHLEIDRKTTKGILDSIQGRITATLADVRAAVEDWPAMTTAMEDAIAGL
ncbi:MAG: hypothetical protein WEB93_05210, partial [Sphingomonadales bacterium]